MKTSRFPREFDAMKRAFAAQDGVPSGLSTQEGLSSIWKQISSQQKDGR